MKTTPVSLDDDAPELFYAPLWREFDALARYVYAVAYAPLAAVIEVEVTELESRTTWRRWGPDDRRGPARNRAERRVHGRRAADRVPAFAMC